MTRASRLIPFLPALVFCAALLSSPEAAPAPPSQKMCHTSTLFFEYNQTDLVPESARRLAALTRVLGASPRPLQRIEVDAYTDSLGQTSPNLTLSQRRAEVIVEALRPALDERATVSFEGHGESSPIARNDTEAGRRRNRRAVVQYCFSPPADLANSSPSPAEEHTPGQPPAARSVSTLPHPGSVHTPGQPAPARSASMSPHPANVPPPPEAAQETTSFPPRAPTEIKQRSSPADDRTAVTGSSWSVAGEFGVTTPLTVPELAHLEKPSFTVGAVAHNAHAGWEFGARVHLLVGSHSVNLSGEDYDQSLLGVAMSAEAVANLVQWRTVGFHLGPLVGVRYIRRSVDVSRYPVLGKTHDEAGSVLNVGVSAQLQWEFAPQWSATAGVLGGYQALSLDDTIHHGAWLDTLIGVRYSWSTLAPSPSTAIALGN